MARFVPRMLRGQPPEPASETPEAQDQPGGATSGGRRPAPRRVRQPADGDAADARTGEGDSAGDDGSTRTANGVRRRPTPRAAGGRRADDDAATEPLDTSPDEVEDAETELDEDTTTDPDESEDEVTGRGDAGDTDQDDDATVPKRRAGASRTTGTTRPKKPARNGRGKSDRDGQTRPERGESRGRTGRKVVAAPRTGSNRRQKMAQAAISRLQRTALNLAVWTVVMGLVLGAAWYLNHRGEVVDKAGQDAMAAATSAAQAIFSYDYRAYDESVQNGSDFVTGKFKSEYAKTTAGLEKTVLKEKAIVRAKVSVASVTDATPERVEVLLFVNQFRRNVNIAGEKVDENRVLLTMVHVEDDSGHGAWLVSDAAAI